MLISSEVSEVFRFNPVIHQRKSIFLFALDCFYSSDTLQQMIRPDKERIPWKHQVDSDDQKLVKVHIDEFLKEDLGFHFNTHWWEKDKTKQVLNVTKRHSSLEMWLDCLRVKGQAGGCWAQGSPGWTHLDQLILKLWYQHSKNSKQTAWRPAPRNKDFITSTKTLTLERTKSAKNKGGSGFKRNLLTQENVLI